METADWGALAAFGASCTWALGSAAYSRLSSKHSAFSINLARALVALPLFLIAVFATTGGLQGGYEAFRALEGRHVFWMALSMVASYGLGDVVFFWSTRSIGVPAALAIASAYPVWTALVGVSFRGESMSALRWVGLLVTLAGLMVVILNTPRVGESEKAQDRPSDAEFIRVGGISSGVLQGVLLAVLTSLFWALNGFSVAQGMQGITPPVGNTVRMAFGLCLSFLLGRWLAPGSAVILPRRELKPYLGLIAVESFGGSLLYLTAFSKAPMVVAATLTSLAPVLAVPAAWFMGLEKFSRKRTLGVLAVVLGLVLLVVGKT